MKGMSRSTSKGFLYSAGFFMIKTMSYDVM
jgi:hypothetical protein